MAANMYWCEEEHYYRSDWSDGFGEAEPAYYEKSKDHVKRKKDVWSHTGTKKTTRYQND